MKAGIMSAFLLLTLATSVRPLSLKVTSSPDDLWYDPPVYSGPCNVECKPEGGCSGPGPEDCNECRHYYNLNSQTCVETCDTATNLTQDQECFVCHEECLGGCDGPSAGECDKCKHFTDPDINECVGTCDLTTHYVYKHYRECGRCHEECVGGCYGPYNYQCRECRHRKSGDTCVSECRDGEYAREDHSDCVKCHEDCLWRCSGPNSTEGEEGCTPCPKPVMTKKTARKDVPCSKKPCYRLNHCLALGEACPERHFEQQVPLDLNVSEEMSRYSGKPICIPCNELCSKCTSYGFNPRVCQECPGYTNCSCPSGTYYDQDYDDCNACAYECKECSNLETCTECGDDYKYRLYGAGFPGVNESFTCTRECPTYQPFSFFSELYKNYCTSINLTEKNNLMSQKYESNDVMNVAVVVLVVLFCGSIVYFQARYQRYTSNFKMEHMQTLDDPEEQLPSSNIAPNRTKLRIIAEDDVIKKEVLGSGAFGVVYSGFLLREGCNARDPVAIKVLNPHNKDSSTKELLKEATIMGRVNHVNLLPLLAICVTSNVMLVTELMPLGDLLHYLHKHNKKIKPKTMANWCLQIAEGMDYLEKHSLVHRDLAVRNVLMQSISRVKVTDFGLARAIKIDQGVYESRGGKLPVKWLALESLKTGIFTHKTDVWSFGVTVWEILTYGKEPYVKCTTLLQVRTFLEFGRRLGQPESCSSDLYTVLATCWAEDSTARPSFQELVETFTMIIQDPGQFIIEFKEDGNQTAPALLPRKYYHEISPVQLFSRSYENISKETNGVINSGAISIAPESEQILSYADLQDSMGDHEG